MSWSEQLTNLRVIQDTVDFTIIDEQNRLLTPSPVGDPEITFDKNAQNFINSALDESIERLRGLDLNAMDKNDCGIGSAKKDPTPSTSQSPNFSRENKENKTNLKSKSGNLKLSDLKKSKLQVLRKVS